MPAVSSQVIGQTELTGHLVADCDQGETLSIGNPIGCQRAGSAAALTAPERIGADHPVTIGIDR